MPKKTREENPSAFKLWINKNMLENMATSLSSVHRDFDRKEFLKIVPDLGPLELKARVRLVRDQLRKQLPAEYPKALKVLLKSLDSKKLSGFDLWPYTEFVQTYGLDHVNLSLTALQKLTQVFTSEFAIRPFILKHPKETLKFLQECAGSPNVHVRRWSSEGTRPRLPWGEKLGPFILDPKPTLPILEKLKHDDELYVRKSVSNHLNDIAKDHPEFVVQVLSRWQKEAPEGQQANIRWIISRSLRTLIKNGHPGALKLVGVDSAAKVKVKNLKVAKDTVKLGQKLEFSFEVTSLSVKTQKLVIDYIIHHRKANKETSPKVFKLKNVTLPAKKALKIQKSHSLKVITTRKYYPGVHFLEIQVNGKVCARVPWTLKI